MNRTGILGVTAGVLAVVCAALAHQVWSIREQSGVERSAASGEIPRDALTSTDETPSVARSTSPTAATSVESAAAASSATPSVVEREARELVAKASIEALTANRFRQGLNDLPSWLYIPESQKDELARLWSVQMTYVAADPSATPGMIAAVEKSKQRQDDAARQIEQLLGPDLHARWREYQDTGTARSLLSAVNARLGEQALSEGAVRSVAAAMRQATRELEEESHEKWLANIEGTYESIDESQRTWQRINELMREAARSRLTAHQLKVLDEVQKRQIEGYERSLVEQRAMVAAREAAAGAGQGGK